HIAIAAAPGEQLGDRRGVEGGESAGYSTPSTFNPCQTWDSNLKPFNYKLDSLTIRPRLPPV
ncbi:hypothetical protein M9458_050743, partial [Cirrhinus mrigala]